MSPRSSTVGFAIVTPSFNQAQFLSECIESVLAQKWPKLSYRVMDGGSTDSSVSILKRYQKEIEWVSKADKGQSDAINKGFRQTFKALKPTDATICAYINSDDYYLPGCFERVAAAFAAHPDRDWLVGDCKIINAEGKPIQPLIKWYKKFWRFFLSPQVLAVLNPVPQPAVFFRASALSKIGEFNQSLRYTMDYDYWLRLFAQCGTPIMLSNELAAFRIHGQSKGGSQFIKQFDEEAEVAQQYHAQSVLTLLHSLHTALIKFVYSLIK